MVSAASQLPSAQASDFATVVLAASADQLVVVDFGAAWCGPCKALAPVLEEIARTEAAQLAVVKVDADAEPELTARYGIRALPTLLFFRRGEVVHQQVGLHSVDALRREIAALGQRLN